MIRRRALPGLLAACVLLVTATGCGRVLRSIFGGETAESALWALHDQPKSIPLESPKPVSPEARVVREMISVMNDQPATPEAVASSEVPLTNFGQVKIHDGNINTL